MNNYFTSKCYSVGRGDWARGVERGAERRGEWSGVEWSGRAPYWCNRFGKNTPYSLYILLAGVSILSIVSTQVLSQGIPLNNARKGEGGLMSGKVFHGYSWNMCGSIMILGMSQGDPRVFDLAAACV